MTIRVEAAARRSICGIEELAGYQALGVTCVLSLVDPDLGELEAFSQFAQHHRTILRFHDIIAPRSGWVMPEDAHIDAIVNLGARLQQPAAANGLEHLLVHCHMGVSRSTAAMLALMAQANPEVAPDELFAELRQIRPQAWPNSRMISMVDARLERGGRLTAALQRHYGVQLKARPEFRSWMAEIGRQAEVDMAL